MPVAEPEAYLAVASRFENIELVQAVVEDLLQRLELGEDDRHWIGLAVREAVANAIKHGRPPITVRLRAESGLAELEVEDRGSGVGEDALARPASPGHLGFLTMAQRAAKLGAELAVADRPEGGTRVRVVWSGGADSQAAEGARAAAT